MTTARNPTAARTIGYPGIALMIAGAVMLLVSFTSLNWYPGSTGADAVPDITFGKLHAQSHGPGVPAITEAYFSWLAWVLLIAVIVVAVLANLPSRTANALRMLGFFLGLVAAALTYLALEEPHEGTTGSALDHAQSGIWLALAGYLVAGIGAVIGPLRAEAA